MSKSLAIYNNILNYIKSYFSIDLCIICLCFSLGVILPTHWFWHWNPAWSYWSGTMMEPWVPKVFVSTLLVILLWVLTILRNFLGNPTRGRATLRAHFRQIPFWDDQVLVQRVALSGVLTILAIGANISFSLVPQAALSFWVQTLTGPFLLAVWIWLMHRTPALRALLLGLLMGVGIQAALAWWQVVTQSQLGGYWLLGQPNFSSILLAKSQISDTVRILPYGSTPHPNVLAGWLVFGLVLIGQSGLLSGKWQKLAWSTAFLFPLAWTESWSAWLTLCILVLMPKWWSATRSQKWLRWASAALLWLAMTWGVVWLPRFVPALQLNPSFSRREVQLSAAPRLLTTSPLGWGPLQHQLGYSPEEKLALRSFSSQPIHAAGIAAVTDLGIWTILLLIAFLILVHKKYSSFPLVFLLSLPIFTLDHFGYSTISGQFLFIMLSLVLYKYRMNR